MSDSHRKSAAKVRLSSMKGKPLPAGVKVKYKLDKNSALASENDVIII